MKGEGSSVLTIRRLAEAEILRRGGSRPNRRVRACHELCQALHGPSRMRTGGGWPYRLHVPDYRRGIIVGSYDRREL